MTFLIRHPAFGFAGSGTPLGDLMPKILNHLEEFFLATMFVTALVVLCIQVVGRFLISFPLPWTEELARLLFLWIVMFGTAYSMRVGQLIAVTVLVDMLPQKQRNAFAFLMHSLTLLFLVVVIWYGVLITIKVSTLPTIAMNVSSAWEYGALPAAAVIMTIRTVIKLVDIAKNGVPQTTSETLI